ncbi:hypothetical protein [Lysobacter sp. CA199]|uniref:hypothetical protein n=1 Tax=Lysobacter sp. CA199 TaxID=3455608 RepID=UPI003F8D1FA5
MATKKAQPSAVDGWHPSLKKSFKDAELWWQTNMVSRDTLEPRLAILRQELDQPGPLRTSINTVYLIAHTYAIRCCTPAAIKDSAVFAEAFERAVTFRALDFRKGAGLSLPHETQPVLAFSASMKAVGPAILSRWEQSEICARVLIDVAEKDLRIKPLKFYSDGWRRGTNDAFLIYLLSEAFGIQTDYKPTDSLIPEYQGLLDVWRTKDASTFQQAMQAAAEFHVSRSRESTNKTTYEFDYTFDRVFPAELLAVQALRRRFELPEFKAEHLLVDTPWSLIRDLPAVDPHPLAVEAEARLRADFPSFR